ncbi:ribosomal RNA small subunit methyltransferase H [Bacteroidia bacterium]|nr:ribosomal RNA small subunit methyltransferase H [Bacteroidia bacterium]
MKKDEKGAMTKYHVPVLLQESIDGLKIKSNGVYLDLTFGGGGHSREILKQLDTGRLIGFDQDVDVLKNLSGEMDEEHFIFVNHNFKYMRHFLRYYGIEQVDGILADLGVSSHEFDEAERGFSFRFEAALDMRMNRRSDLKASDILNSYDREALLVIFRNYGEVENAKFLTDTIIQGRARNEIRMTEDFLQLIAPCVPKQKEKKYLAKVYQALRIEVNKELDALSEMLLQSKDVLKTGARISIITYHSLEDRMVKNVFKTGNIDGIVEKDPIYGHVKKAFEEVNRRVITPSEEEIGLNPRARSAKLRIAEKK